MSVDIHCGVNTGDPGTSTVFYHVEGRGGTFDANEDKVRQVLSGTGNNTSFAIKLDAAPGAGNSRAFELYLNGVGTGNIVTLTTAAIGTWTGTLAYVPGDYISWRHTTTGTPAAITKVQTEIVFTPTLADEYMIFGISNTNFSTSGSERPVLPLACGKSTSGYAWVDLNSGSGLEEKVKSVWPTHGNYTRWEILTEGLTAGNSLTFSLRTYSKGGSLVSTFTSTSLSSASPSYGAAISLRVEATQQALMEHTRGSGSAGGIGTWCLTWVGEIPQQQPVMGTTIADVNSGGKSYGIPGGDVAFTTTEADHRLWLNHSNRTFKNMVGRSRVAPGSGVHRHSRLVLNGVATGLYANVKGSNTTGDSFVSDWKTWLPENHRQVSLTAGDEFSFEMGVRNGTAQASSAAWGFVIAPAVPTVVPTRLGAAALAAPDLLVLEYRSASTIPSGNDTENMEIRWTINGGGILEDLFAGKFNPNTGVALDYFTNWKSGPKGVYGPAMGAKILDASGTATITCHVWDPLSGWGSSAPITLSDSGSPTISYTRPTRTYYRVGSGGSDGSPTGTGTSGDPLYYRTAQAAVNAFVGDNNTLLLNAGETHANASGGLSLTGHKHSVFAKTGAGADPIFTAGGFTVFTTNGDGLIVEDWDIRAPGGDFLNASSSSPTNGVLLNRVKTSGDATDRFVTALLGPTTVGNAQGLCCVNCNFGPTTTNTHDGKWDGDVLYLNRWSWSKTENCIRFLTRLTSYITGLYNTFDWTGWTETSPGDHPKQAYRLQFANHSQWKFNRHLDAHSWYGSAGGAADCSHNRVDNSVYDWSGLKSYNWCPRFLIQEDVEFLTIANNIATLGNDTGPRHFVEFTDSAGVLPDSTNIAVVGNTARLLDDNSKFLKGIQTEQVQTCVDLGGNLVVTDPAVTARLVEIGNASVLTYSHDNVFPNRSAGSHIGLIYGTTYFQANTPAWSTLTSNPKVINDQFYTYTLAEIQESTQWNPTAGLANTGARPSWRAITDMFGGPRPYGVSKVGAVHDPNSGLAPFTASGTTGIEIDNTGGGSQTDYPVRVALNSGNFNWTRINSDGKNVRFYDPVSGDYQPWLLRRFDPTAQVAEYWVKVPSLAVAVQTLTMHHNSAAGEGPEHDEAGLFMIDSDDFRSPTNGRLSPYGTDSGFGSAFDPVSRRVYTFGSDSSAGAGCACIQWVNIDTKEVGFVIPSGTYTSVHSAGVVYHPTKKKFYLYGGRNTAGSRVNLIQSFDPATGVAATLTETLPSARSSSGVAVSQTGGASDGFVFIFGGYTGAAWITTFHYHNIDAGTVTQITATLGVGQSDITAKFTAFNNRIYLFGGNFSATGDTNAIKYITPDSLAATPISFATSVLAAPSENQAVAEDGSSGVFYIFGGVDRAPAPDLYQNTIQKFDAGADTISTVGTTPRADDDLFGFYDSVNDRIYAGPFLHSSQATDNVPYEKMVWMEFNTNTDTIGAEPALGSFPGGWTSEGSSAVDDAENIASTCITLADHETGANVGIGKPLATGLSAGVVAFDIRVQVPEKLANYQFNAQEGSTGIGLLHSRNGNDWNIRNTVNTVIAPIISGWQTLTLLIDFAAARQYGQRDYANQTSAQVFAAAISTAIDNARLQISTAERGGLLADWYQVRKSQVVSPVVTSLGTPAIAGFGDRFRDRQRRNLLMVR